MSTQFGTIRGVLGILLILRVTIGPAFPQTPAPIQVAVREGDGALNNIKLQKAKEPVVVVTGANDAPIKGASVTFLLPELGPSGLFPSGSALVVTTDENGVATGRGLKPNNVAGQFQIRVVASYQGSTARAVVTQTNAAPAQASSGGSGKLILLVALIGGGGAAAALGLTRSNKSAGAAPNPGTVITPGSSTFVPPR